MNHYNHINFILTFRFNSTIGVIRSTRVIIYFNPIASPKLRWLISCIIEKIFFDVPLLYYYINLRSSITCLFFLEVYTQFLVFLVHFQLFLNYSAVNFLRLFVVLSAFLLRIKSSNFWVALSKAVLSASVGDCLAWSINVWLYLAFTFCLYFYRYFCPYF